jgi:uncharacterized protein (TIGR03086 family)
MTAARARVGLTGGVALLERAVGYTLGGLLLVTPEAMTRPTPCRQWDLRALLLHLNDSVLALHEAVALHRVALDPVADGGPAEGLVAALRSHASRMLGAWTAASAPDPVAIGGRPLAADIVATAGAVEIAVHGWDVARACGRDRPIPPALAEELLDLVPLVVTDADRPSRFAAPVPAPWPASPGDRLVAFLGRR